MRLLIFNTKQQNPQMSSNKASQQYTRKKIENYSYGLNDIIGKGYSSQVYKGVNDENSKAVAVKVIDLKMLKNEINRLLLESEIQILKELKQRGCCENILTLHDVYTTKNNTYLITELCEADLNKVVKSRLTEPEAYFFMDQFMSGYRSIYRHDVVHRDLKPANLLITHDKCLKVADFGFAIKTKELTKPSKYNVGSPLYMAPESLKRNEYSFKTDMWSIGVIFFEMLTGDTPWRAKTEKDLIKKIESDNIVKILESKKFSKMTSDFLIKILCFDKSSRMSPHELESYSFKDCNFGSNILCEKKLNSITNRNARFESVSTNGFTSPKNAFNNTQSIDKNFFQKQKSDKGLATNHKPVNKLAVKHESQTMKEISENRQPQASCKNLQSRDISKPNNNPESGGSVSPGKTSEDKKSISKILISMVHFCRFLFKLLNRVKESESHGILKEVGYFEVQSLYYSYTKIIKHLIHELQSFKHKNFLKLTPKMYQSYKEASDFNKLMKISHEYHERYSSELKSYWEDDFTQSPRPKNEDKFSSIETVNLIKTMVGFMDEVITNGGFEYEYEKEAEVQKFSKDIVIVDYLMTAKQLIEMFAEKEDYGFFSKKSRIQDIVEGTTSEITYSLYNKILDKAKGIAAKTCNTQGGHQKARTTSLNGNKTLFSQTLNLGNMINSISNNPSLIVGGGNKLKLHY